MNKPYSESCEQNRKPILDVLKHYLVNSRNLLEIGSGTGQHAVYFAPELPQLTWQTSDQVQYHEGIRAWLAEDSSSNIFAPLSLNVLKDTWPGESYDAVFSANTAHIMDDAAVVAMFSGVGEILSERGLFLLYGPFNIEGQFTSLSNERFDQWLKSRDPDSGIKDKTWLEGLASGAGLRLLEDIEMPANNKVLCWIKE